jgi:mono/diheme cytochrome c family protein
LRRNDDGPLVRRTFWLAALLWLALFAALKFGIRPPMPASVLTLYMVLASLAILVFVAANEARFKNFVAPLVSVFDGRAPRVLQAIVFAAIPAAAAWAAYMRMAPSVDAPFQPRVVHPEPPSQFAFRGRRIEPAGLKNPLREAAVSDPKALATLIAGGKRIYYQNCFFCHGDTLAGDGHFAPAFRPLPANFRDVGTLSMLQESYVFWRVATGGPGLPKGATPWNSAMPVWQDLLTEEEVWKVILFIYAGSGSTPRTWEDGPIDHSKH